MGKNISMIGAYFLFLLPIVVFIALVVFIILRACKAKRSWISLLTIPLCGIISISFLLGGAVWAGTIDWALKTPEEKAAYLQQVESNRQEEEDYMQPEETTFEESKNDPLNESEEEKSIVDQFETLGLSHDEAIQMEEIFITVGITEISNIEPGAGDGIDNLQSYRCNIFDYNTSLILIFTIENRQLCYISLNGIPTTKVEYAYINIFGDVKFKTTNGKRSVTLYDIWNENGEIIPNAIGYKAIFDYDNKTITAYK